VIVRITHRKQHRSFYCKTLLSVTSVRVIFNQWGGGLNAPTPTNRTLLQTLRLIQGCGFGLETVSKRTNVSSRSQL